MASALPFDASWPVLIQRKEWRRLSNAAWPAAPGVVATNALDPTLNPPALRCSAFFFLDPAPMR